MNLILIGPQGCGKGTQAQKIIDQFHFHHLETGQLIRSVAQGTSRKAKIIDQIANQKGQLLPDGVILDLIQDFLSQTGYDDLLFDGFPRTVNQYIALKEVLKQNHQLLDKALYISISDDEAIKRLSSRRICQTCHRSFSLFLEPNRSQCECGGQLQQRSDDHPDAIKKRLESFHHLTQPILDLMQQDKILVEINGERAIDDIFQDIAHQLHE